MKRITAIILVAVILVSSFAPVNAAEKSTTENKKIKWLIENNFVVGRGQDKDLKLEDNITRAEFTRMILASKGEENLAKEASNLKADFKDVPKTHWAEKYIAYAKEKGYISGYPDGNFRPEGKITYEELISILSRIHPNYTNIEAKSTNWAEGFINFAKISGILDNINIVGGYKSPAIREKTFEMIYNFINIADNQTKSEKVSKTKEEKEVKKESSTWNGFYPYWLGYGFKPSVEEKPEVKPTPDKPVKPGTPGTENPVEPSTEPEAPSEPGTEPETPKEFDKTKIDKIEVASQPSKLEYKEDETLDLTGLTLKLTDANGKEKEIGLADFEEYGITTDPANEAILTTNENGTTIKIKLNDVEKAETDALTVNKKVFDENSITTIEVKTQPTKLEYTDGEKLDLIGLEVTLTDNQGLIKDVLFTEFGNYNITAEPASGTTLTVDNHNGKTVKIIKGEATAETDPLTVKEKVFDENNITKIEVKDQPTKLVYTEGELLDLTGLEVILTDNQGLKKDVAFADFGSNGITTDPANETALTVDNHNGKTVKITKGSLSATTETLTVKEKELLKIGKDPNETVPNGYTRITFDAGEGNTIDGTNRFKVIDVLTGTAWDNAKVKEQIPNSAVPTDKTKEFDKWNEPIPTSGNVETKVFTAEYKSKVKFIEVTDLGSQAPEGYARLTFDATAAGKIDNAQVKVIDVLEGTTYDDAELKAKIKEVIAAPTGKTKEFKGWNPEIPTTGNVEKKTFTAEYKSKVKFIEVTDLGSQAPEGYARLTFDATAAGKIDNAQVKAFDVLEGTTYDDAELKAKIKEVIAAPTDTTKEFKGWNPEIPTTGNVETKEYKAEYKEKVFDKNNITKIEVIAPPTKLNYVVDELLNLDGLKVRLTDNQDITKEIGAAELDSYGITTKPENETKLTINENGKEVVISRENKEVNSENISLKLKVISQADFDKENKLKKSIKNSLVEVYKNLGDLKLGIDNLQNKYYLLFTKDANEIAFDKAALQKSLLEAIKTNKIKSYTIGETKRDLTKPDDEILGFIREDILKLAGLEWSSSATDKEILEKLKETKPSTKIKLEVGDNNINLDYEIIFLTQMAEEKLDQIEADFAKHMQETSKIVEKKSEKLKVSYNNNEKKYKVQIKGDISHLNIFNLATDYRYDIVLTNFLTGEKLGESKSLKELKSFMVHTIRSNLDIDNRGIMDSMELQTLLGGGNYRIITESYHNTFRNNLGVQVVGESLFHTITTLEYFYTDEISGTGGIITRIIRYEKY